MEDERLLAEALRAHAAGGVSTPAGASGPDDVDEGVTHPAEGSSRVGGRFRPLGRGRRASSTTSSTASSTASATGSPQAVTVDATPAGGRPPAASTPAGGRPVVPARGVAPGPRPAAMPGGPVPPGAPAPPRPEPAGWTGTRVAWWSAVAVLGGGVLGAVLAVISLAAPG